MNEYLDASVIVKWFKKDERHHKASIRILDDIRTLEKNSYPFG